MTPLDLAKAYLAKGQEDEAVLGEFVDNPRISDSVFGFHAQQAIEKYLKAILALREESPARTTSPCSPSSAKRRDTHCWRSYRTSRSSPPSRSRNVTHWP